MRQILIFIQLRILKQYVSLLINYVPLRIDQVPVLVDSPPHVIPECLHIEYDVAEVVDVERPQYVVQVEILTRDSPLASDEALTVIVELNGVLACGAWQVRQVVYQVLQEVLREVRVVLHRSVLVRKQKVTFTVERVVADGDISLVGLGAAGYILVLNVLLFA